MIPAFSECTDVLDFLPSAIKEIENHGFVNYFGGQRFRIEHAVVNVPRIGLAMHAAGQTCMNNLTCANFQHI